ncbi:MAG: hypothetical protein KIT09_13700 [Bryobacteraceae bacterium]|nr:hypothetical protein [Bryobacteraceae bacterium]
MTIERRRFDALFLVAPALGLIVGLFGADQGERACTPVADALDWHSIWP